MTLFEISHTSNLFIREKSDVVEFFYLGEGICFFWGGEVQSPESRVQSPGSSPAFRIRLNFLCF